jgi:glucose/arabinose dehydrogenase
LLAGLAGLVVLSAVGLGVYFTSTSAPDSDTLPTTGLIALVRGNRLEVHTSEGDNAGAVPDIPVDGYVAWSTDTVSLGYGRGDTLYWSPTNLQFSRKVGNIVPGSRFYWSPSGKELLVQKANGVSIVDKADKQVWHIDGGMKPLGWWTVTGLVGSAVVVADGSKVNILSTYNNEVLWSFDAIAAYPNPTGPSLLLQRAEGWAFWEPQAGLRPIPNVAKSGSAAWDPTGQRVAIEASGSGGDILVNMTDLKTAPLGAAGQIVGWTGDLIAIVRGDSIELVKVGTKDTRSFDGASFAGIQPTAPPAASTARPGRVTFVPLARLGADGMSVAATPHPDGQTIYIADLTGRVIADRGGAQTIMLDLRDQVTAWDESGLLDVVLHPKFPQNRTAYVYYGFGGVTDKGDIGPRRNFIASFEIGADSVSVVPNTFRVRHTIPTPRQTPMAHNGATIAFGTDGRLYLGLGDLGDHEAAADPKTLSGSFLSFDVDQPGEWARTIVGYGFRNPFRFWPDPVTAQIWIGDVGGIVREEIDVLTRGGNFGWPVREGEVCRATHQDCDAPGLPPVHAWYPYTDPHTCGAGVVGGFVYRGSAMPNLRGWYIYSDQCSGDILALDPAATPREPVTLGRVPGAPDWGAVVDLVPDAKGEPLAVGLKGGVWRLTPGN